MEFINENIRKAVLQIRERAEEAVNQAIQQAANAKQVLARHGVDRHILDQIRNAQASVHAIVEKIASLKNQIALERKPIEEKLSEMHAAVTRARGEVDNISAQIKTKEKEIDRLSKDAYKFINVQTFGKIRVPNPQTIARTGALRVEIAGLHGAMASAQTVLANTTHALEAFHAQAAHMPIEADPRIIALYKELEAEKAAIASLTEQKTGAVRKALQECFTPEHRHQMAIQASKRIDTGLPDTVEQALFYDAVAKIEQTVMEVLPSKVLEMIQDAEHGISGDTKVFETRLIEKINANVDIPMLDEKQESELFAMLIRMLIESMKPGRTLEAVLSTTLK